MDRYLELDKRLKYMGKKAFIPFVTIGDPSPEVSFKLIEYFIQAGASALELGLPFSDPLADGVVIQKANLRALEAGVYTPMAFDVIKKIRNKYPAIPIGLLSYTNLATGYGNVDEFFKQLFEIGVDSLLLADMPFEMRGWISSYFDKYNIKQVLIAPPNADIKTLENIATTSQGYIYLVGRSGVTGTELKAQTDLSNLITCLKSKTNIPVYQGFGISTIEDAKYVSSTEVDGFIIGSAIVKIIEEYHKQGDEILLSKIRDFIDPFIQLIH